MIKRPSYRRPKTMERSEQPFFSPATHDAVQTKEEKTPFFQTKSTHGNGLTIGQPGDPYEKEADTMADAVVHSSAHTPAIQQKKINIIQRASQVTPQEDEPIGTAEHSMEKHKEVQTKLEVQRQVEEEEPAELQQQEEEEEPAELQQQEEEEEPAPAVQSMSEKEEDPGVQKMEEEEETSPAVQSKGEDEEEPSGIQAKSEEEENPDMQKKEEEEEEEAENLSVQTKPDGSAGNKTSSILSDKIEHSRGKGHPMSDKIRTEMENAFGVDFRGVNLHTDQQAIEMNKGLHAQAFTHGPDIYFNAGKFNPETGSGKHLLAHELTHVVQQETPVPKTPPHKSNATGPPLHQTNHNYVSKQGLLSPGEEAAGILFNYSRYDGRSRRIIQNIVGVNVDGVMGSVTVEAIAAFQNANGLTPDGKVGENTLNVMVNNRVLAGLQEHAIQLVVDFHNLDTSQLLSISFDAGIGVFGLANTSFEPGGLRVIRLGPLAFLSAGVLHTVIRQQLALPAPVVAPAGALPDHLTTAQETAANHFNKSKYSDLRSIRGIQGAVGAQADGIFGVETAERIAAFQNSRGLATDGKAGEQTLRTLVQQLDTNNEQNAAIRLIMDFYSLSEHGALLDIRFDANLTTSNASTSGIIPGPSMVRIGPPAFGQGFEGLVHTIAHELEHVRQRKLGILNQDLREFLAEAVEILSAGMPEEGVAGFFDDARRALNRWNNLPVAEQRANWGRFEAVRNKVRQSFNLASAADQATHLPTLNGYNAVVRP